MRYLIDTNVVSDSRRATATALNSWITRQRVTDLAISTITIFELEIGIRRKERRDPAQGAVLRRWLDDQVADAFSGRVLPITETVSRAAASLHVPDPMPTLDALIAATALVHGLTVVTRNVSDFERSGAAVLNPWELGD